MNDEPTMSKFFTKRVLLLLLILVSLCIVHSVFPTLGRQIPFNEWIWKHYPVHKIRYYMSESLIEKMNAEKPDIGQVAKMLGPEMMGGHRIQLGDTWVSYFLRTPTFLLIGLDMYTLDIYFAEDGSFQSASVVFSD